MTRDALLNNPAVAGHWTDQNENQIKGLQDDLHKCAGGLLDYLFKVEQLENIRTTIREAEKALMDRFVKQVGLPVESAEPFALMAQ